MKKTAQISKQYINLLKTKNRRLKKKDLLYKLLLDENKKEIMFNIFTQEEIDSFIKHMKEKEKNDKKTEKMEKNEINNEKLNKKDVGEEAATPINALDKKLDSFNGSQIKEENSSKSTNASSRNNSNSNSNSFEPKEEIIYDKIPQPEDDNQMKNDFSDLANLILKKCRINLSVGKNGGNNNIKIKDILMGEKLSLKTKEEKFNN